MREQNLANLVIKLEEENKQLKQSLIDSYKARDAAWSEIEDLRQRVADMQGVLSDSGKQFSDAIESVEDELNTAKQRIMELTRRRNEIDREAFEYAEQVSERDKRIAELTADHITCGGHQLPCSRNVARVMRTWHLEMCAVLRSRDKRIAALEEAGGLDMVARANLIVEYYAEKKVIREMRQKIKRLEQRVAELTEGEG
jgi:predicted phage tail protein